MPLHSGARSARFANLSYAAAMCSISRLARGSVIISASARASWARRRQKSASCGCVTRFPRLERPRAISHRTSGSQQSSKPAVGEPDSCPACATAPPPYPTLSAGKVHRRRPEKPVQGHAPAATRNVDVRCDRLAPVPQCRAQAHSEPSSLRAKRDLGENCKPR